MPNLAQLTDYYPQQDNGLPVEQPYLGVPADSDGMRRVYISKPDIVPRVDQPITDNRPEPRPEPGYTDAEYFSKPVAPLPDLPKNNLLQKIIKKLANTEFSKGNKTANNLFGLEGDRYQLWPEKVIRAGISAAGDAVKDGTILPGLRREDFTDIPSPNMPTKDSTQLGSMLGLAPVAWSPQDNLIEKAQEISALAGTGGLAGTTDATLGATPFLRPALKYKDRLYKGKEGQQHQDIIPKDLYPEFERMAINGEDISHYSFGFVNDKGHFLNRENALKYGIDTGLISPHAGKYGALTSTLMADSSKPGTAIEAMKAEPFYSALEHNVGKIDQNKMTGEQWLGTLANKPGVKAEEMQWTGLQDFLTENKGKSVTKEQIQDHLNNNKVELKEVNKEVASEYSKLSGKEQTELIYQYADNNGINPSRVDATDPDFLNFVKNNTNHLDNTKYSSYQLPGAEPNSYREMLLTLPERQFQTAGEAAKKLFPNAEFKNLTPEQINIINNQFNGKVPNPDYKSSHWDEPNILAHVRMNDRLIDGKKSLHLEEIQSDWHQQGRDKGYKLDIKKLNEKELNDYDILINKKRDGNQLTNEESTRLDNLIARANIEDVNYNGVPDAPFKKSWHELALKRMIREAAEKDYNILSWTKGENHPTNPKNLNQTGPDADTADKGMRGFYNDIIPKALEKLGKEHGVKVKQTDLGKPIYNAKAGKWYVKNDPKNKIFNSEEEAKSAIQSIHYIDIPQSLKDQAMSKGFPLFSKGGFMFQPVDHNPFEDDKLK